MHHRFAVVLFLLLALSLAPSLSLAADGTDTTGGDTTGANPPSAGTIISPLPKDAEDQMVIDARKKMDDLLKSLRGDISLIEGAIASRKAEEKKLKDWLTPNGKKLKEWPALSETDKKNKEKVALDNVNKLELDRLVKKVEKRVEELRLLIIKNEKDLADFRKKVVAAIEEYGKVLKDVIAGNVKAADKFIKKQEKLKAEIGKVLEEMPPPPANPNAPPAAAPPATEGTPPPDDTPAPPTEGTPTRPQ